VAAWSLWALAISAAPLEGPTVAVVAELLAAAAGALDRGSRRWFVIVLEACPIVCGNRP
jgi:hypothetical protein